MQHPILETTLIVLFTVLLVNLTFRFFRLPIILGYLVVGIFVGPHVLGWIPNTETITPLAEFGIVFLMFTIGLEFSFSKLFTLKYAVFVLGGLQVILSIAITMAVGLLFHMTPIQAFIVGSIVAMSSTALVIKILSEQFEVHSLHGLNAVGILLFQDLAVIPILTIIGSLTGDGSLSATLPIALLRGLLAIIVIIGFGRWFLRPLFRLIAATRIVELFTLSVLFIAIGSAWLTGMLGMTLALGAFLSGIMLGETEFRHQIKSEIRPFRDILLGLFFVSIGMLAEVNVWLHDWPWIILLLAAIMLGKSFLIISICRLSGCKLVTATRTALILAQGGEFGFAIFSFAYAAKLLPPDYAQVVLAALLISFGVAPIIIQNNQRIAKRLLPKKIQLQKEQITEGIEEAVKDLENHVIICGFGRVGQHIARFLKQSKLPFIAFELDPEIIHNATQAAEPVLYGNVTHSDILLTANLHKASAVVISFNDLSAATHVLAQIQLTEKNIPTFVRCKDETEFEVLLEHGASKIVTEVFEESLTLAHYLLEAMHIPHSKIHRLLQSARQNDYQFLSGVFPGSFFDELPETGILSKQLRTVVLPDESCALTKHIRDLDMQQVEIISVIRNKKVMQIDKVKLQAEDILILYGLPADLDQAENNLSSET